MNAMLSWLLLLPLKRTPAALPINFCLYRNFRASSATLQHHHRPRPSPRSNVSATINHHPQPVPRPLGNLRSLHLVPDSQPAQPGSHRESRQQTKADAPNLLCPTRPTTIRKSPKNRSTSISRIQYRGTDSAPVLESCAGQEDSQGACQCWR
jgi:hypothetical protein